MDMNAAVYIHINMHRCNSLCIYAMHAWHIWISVGDVWFDTLCNVLYNEWFDTLYMYSYMRKEKVDRIKTFR